MNSPEHEQPFPEVEYMSCPMPADILCLYEMDRNEFAVHLSLVHPDHRDDPEPFFELERNIRSANNKGDLNANR